MTSVGTPIVFELIIVNGLVGVDPKKFTVPTTKGKTLLEALDVFRKGDTNFGFRTKKNPNVGQYVVEVMGTLNQSTQFWETLLCNPNDDIIPINLDYKVFNNDTVFLQYTPMLFPVCNLKE